MTSAITSRATFGEKCKDEQEFILLMKNLGKIAERLFVIFDLFPSYTWLHLISGVQYEAEKLHKEFDMIIENIIRDKVRNKRNGGSDESKVEDLLSILLNLVEDPGAFAFESPLTMNNVKAIIFG
ncbi:Tabersonine 16-hydroxylase [Arachis hypogaea]|nr:Tabersonine 16-hydroxylase [Arachis hypogaea]